MKRILLMIALVALVGCGGKALTKEESAKVIEAAIRKAAKKPTGELTKAELEGVTFLTLALTPITDVGLKEVARMKNLTSLTLIETKVTQAGVGELQKALPKCDINSNPKK